MPWAGSPGLTVAATIAEWVLDDPDRKARCQPIKDGRLLVKAHPQLDTCVEWAEAFAILDASEGCESKDVAPLGNCAAPFFEGFLPRQGLPPLQYFASGGRIANLQRFVIRFFFDVGSRRAG